MDRFKPPYYGLFHVLARQKEPEALRLALLGCLSVIVPGGAYAILGLSRQGELKTVGEASAMRLQTDACAGIAKHFIQHAEPGEFSATNSYFFVAVTGITGKAEAVVVSANVSPVHYDAIQSICVHYNCLMQLLGRSVTDALTGLFNRKAFDYILERSYKRLMHNVKQRTTDAFVVMVDIDHFKSVNDRFGHLFGDEVLLRVSQVIHNSIREHDRAFRYGGEEFAVILNQLDSAQALTACERIRHQVNECIFPQLDGVSVSIGVDRFTSAYTPMCCVEHADKALYYSKEHGRNQVNSYWKLIESGQLQAKKNQNDVELF